MIHRMREYNDLDSNLWEFYIDGYDQFKYRVVDVTLPLPGLESTSLNTGQKYWSDVQHPEEISVTLRETDSGHVFSLLWLWQNEIYDFKQNVFKTKYNQTNPGGKKTGHLMVQKPRFGGLLNFAKIKFLQEIGGVGGSSAAASQAKQMAQFQDILSGGQVSSAIEDLIYSNELKFEIQGMRPKKIDDMSFQYGNTEGKDISATFLIDDIDVNTTELMTKFNQMLGFYSGMARQVTGALT